MGAAPQIVASTCSALALVSGCYTATPVSGVPCDPDKSNCPNGQRCVMSGGGFVCDKDGDPTNDGGPDAPITANDSDGDGKPNASDNCPTVSNANQYNEDNDTFGDACDKCPPFPDSGADGDNDGVGDACDPRPQMAGDVLALFEGFSANQVPAGWMQTGSWMTVAGSLVVVGDDAVKTLVVPYTNTANQTIYTQATIVSEAQDSGGSLGIVDRFDGIEGIQCGGGRSGDTELLGLINASNGVFIDQNPHPFAVGTQYKLAFTRTADRNYVCTSEQPNGQPVQVQAEFDNADGAHIGFRTRVVTSSYAYILVVRSP